MSFFDDEQQRLKEESKHAKTGGCIAAILLLIIVPCLCWILAAYTNGGRVIVAHATLLYAYNGLPLTAQTAGIPQIAQMACALDRTKPANYRRQQERLAELYESKVKLYQQQWNILKKAKQDTSFHEDMEKIPGSLASSKLIYCAR